MPYPDSDCVCVQGIEQYIDPRLTLPTMESPDINSIDIPIWRQKEYDDYLKAVEDQKNKAASVNALVSVDRVLNLYVQGLNLVTKGFTHLVAYQRRSFGVTLESLDKYWVGKPVSLVFQNVDSGEQGIVPIIELGKKYYIPDNVLTPGELKVSAIVFTKDVDYSSTVTESLTLRVYDPDVKPIDWGNIPAYDVYREFYSTVISIKKDIANAYTPYKLKSTLEYYIDGAENNAIQELEVSTIVDTSPVCSKVYTKSCIIDNLQDDTTYVFTLKYPEIIDGKTEFIPGEPGILQVNFDISYIDPNSEAEIKTGLPWCVFGVGKHPVFTVKIPKFIDDETVQCKLTLVFSPHIYY